MIRVANLNKTYDRRRRNENHVLKDVSFDLPDTGFVCILGPSGCGKTSLLNALGGLDRFDNGTITAGEVSVNRYGKRAYEAERNRNFGYIFQNYYLLPEHSVAYNIYLGLHSLKLTHAEKLTRIRQALEAVDMSRYIRRKVGELSGGQQQRVAIARALARRPRVIFADEPTGNLDEANTMNICTLLRQISRQSLVIMVTHEERIASFFADRIIRLDGGRVSSDQEVWDRDGMALRSDKEIYAGDHLESRLKNDGVSLHFVQEEGAAPLELTVVALKDRVVIKLSDGRAVTCGTDTEPPVVRQGKSPTMTLETVDQKERSAFVTGEPAPQARAGHGIRFGMMRREAKHLLGTGGAKRIGMRLFLVLLTVLTMWTACDFITVSSVDPESFIHTDSHILEIKLKRGGGAGLDYVGLEDLYKAYTAFVAEAEHPFYFMPTPISSVSYSAKVFPQMAEVSAYLEQFNYAPVTELEETTLIHGRLPQKAGEVVVDRWVLENVIKADSITKNAMKDVSFFLDQTLHFERCNYDVTVVGICDSGEPAMYLTTTDIINTTTVRRSLMALSEFKSAHPGEYDGLTLADGECLVNANAAGHSYTTLVGHQLDFKNGFSWTIRETVQTADSAAIIISDSEALRFIRYQCNAARFYLYCSDKQAMKDYLATVPEELAQRLTIDVVDEYTEAYDAYMEASRVKVNARTVVTATVMLLSLVMLYLLCRSQARDRIGMMAVYRLLGIPGSKLRGIFLLEGVLISLRTALPAAVAAFVVLTILGNIEQLGLKLILPPVAAVLVYLGILAYHLLVAVQPLGKLLRLPPAQLASKYDY